MQKMISVWVVLLVLCISHSVNNRAQAFNFTTSYWLEGRAPFRIGDFPNDNPPSNSTANNTELRQAFIEAMQAWSSSSSFLFDVDTINTVNPCAPSGTSPQNGAIFWNTRCDDSAFGEFTLAVTSISFSTSTGGTLRTGITFNNTKAWGVYSGPQQPGSNRFDFRRVAVHELGHALGLAHEDNGSPAIMRSNIGNIEVPQTDDINGVAARYGAGIDPDNDGIASSGPNADNCPVDFNPNQENNDGDNLGDACDNCPNDTNQNQADLDDDDIGDACDNDIDGDTVANVADTEPTNNRICGVDSDSDLCDDCNSGILDDGSQTGGLILSDGSDTDSDGQCNLTDPDDDGDGVSDDFPDNCQFIFNPGQEDADMNGIGDVCDGFCVPIKSSNGSVAIICL